MGLSRCVVGILFLSAVEFTCLLAIRSLDHFVSDYERASVQLSSDGATSSLYRRDTEQVRITIRTPHRKFLVRLLPNERLLGRNVKAIAISREGSEEIAFDRRQFKIGHVEGFADSRVHGRWDSQEEIFDGVIHLSNESFHVEPAARYFEGSRSSQSIVYKESDVIYNRTNTFCPEKLKSMQESIMLKNEKARSKRRFIQFDPEYNTCPVFVVADHLFYSGPGESNEPRTITEMTYHIEQANQMFRETEFSSEIQNIGFRIDKILIYKDNQNPDYPFLGSFGVEELLDTFSEMDFSEYCLGHLFTYRDFDSGVIGLAWVGGTASGTGGVCEQNRVRTNQGERSLNTGLTTLLNYGRLVPRSVSAITTTHELGHNFGSPHDEPGGECTPGGSAGNFIMFASATDGSLPNNRKFSPCSAETMASVISAKWSLTCFSQENRGPQCGNGVIEEGEECDCGSSSPEECNAIDPCCTPGNCTLRDGALCSPLVKPCCNDSCIFSMGICRLEEECLTASYCNGSSGDCPPPQPKPNNETCNEGANFCQNGECTGSACSQWNAESCVCADSLQVCHVCCVWDNLCRSTEDQPGVNLTFLRAGTTCMDLTGYCTQDGACKVVDNQTPLDDLKNILNKINLGDIADWLKKNWYIAVAGFAGLIVFLVIVHFTYRRKYPEKFVKGKERDPLLPEEY
ncbi:disintegrin and metalloproteinase domain-containing protein 10-like [Oscarella lobularis]|uniref:disintegrin and metalloproteinase domain-containing protein 10-like n=1 Tax=Oscarella lobularis TaxID=121494 RepID=UPI0033137260